MEYPEQYQRTIYRVFDFASADESLLPTEYAHGKGGNPPGVIVFVAHHGHYWVHLHAHDWPERMGR